MKSLTAVTRNLAIALFFTTTGMAHTLAHGSSSPDILFKPFHGGSGNSHIQDLNTNYRLYKLCRDDVEGYHEMLSGAEFFSYPSIREDIGTSMIARATTGKMGFEFLTGKIPLDHTSDQVTFLFLSDIDLNQRASFDLQVNGKPLLTFHANEDGSLTVTDNPGNGNAEYILVKRDQNGDGIGAFRLTVPAYLVKKGEHTRLSMVGHHEGSNSWIMIFKAQDALDRIKKSVAGDAAFAIKQKKEVLYVDAPAYFAGKPVYCISDGITSNRKVLQTQGDLSKASFMLPPPKQRFTLVFGEEELSLNFEKGDGFLSVTAVEGEYLYHHQTAYQDGWTATLTKLFRPEFFETYSKFLVDKYENGLVSLMNSSHQDIAWVDRPEVCRILRDTLLLSPVIKDAFAREDYGFDIEDGLMLREYLDRHPASREKLTTLLNQKLLSVGATYNCPYEDMYDAEDQVRQLYLGKKWVKKTFGGYDSKVYWNVDVPGKSLQTPQILKKAGVDYMVISRHAKSMFYWQSPDGSSVFTYSPGHYGNDLLYLSRDLNSKIKYGAEQVLFWEPVFEGGDIHTPLLSSQDMLPAIDYSEFIKTWNGFKTLKDQTGTPQNVYLPDMELMTVDEFLPLAEKQATRLDTILGERPNVWVYIHGPGHHEALTASREASKLLPAAEKFLAIAYLLDPNRRPYPAKELEEAWQAKIYPDHGWGGHDGDVTDNLFKENLVQSRTMGNNLLKTALDFMASRIKVKEEWGIPVVLFNSLSWERTDPVTLTVNFPKGSTGDYVMLTADQKKVPTQMSRAEYDEDGNLKRADITFIAENIPSIGYTTYYLANAPQEDRRENNIATESAYENPFYHLRFEKGGIAQVYDKELKKELFTTADFKAGDIITLRSEGNGAGEFGDIQQPSMQDFDQVSLHHPEWIMLEQGPVFTKYRLEQPLKHAVVRQDVTLFHDLKRLYFHTSLRNWSGELYREFRTVFPIQMDQAEIAYEVPFGSVRVGKDEIKTAGERYTPLCKDVHPRAILDWISATNDSLSITMSSSVAVADWIDPTGKAGNRALLQHVLLASRTSCHWEGNEYAQAGHHDFEWVVTSHRPGNREGQKIARQKNEPLYAVLYPETSVHASLPASASFFSLDSDQVMISALKKAEDSDDLIVRMYNVSDTDLSVHVTSWFPVSSWQHTNIIEEDPTPVAPALVIGKFAIETFRLEVRP